MFDQRFFASKVGLSALVSVAAMVAFNLYAASLQAPSAAELNSAHGSVVLKSAELA